MTRVIKVNPVPLDLGVRLDLGVKPGKEGSKGLKDQRERPVNAVRAGRRVLRVNAVLKVFKVYAVRKGISVRLDPKVCKVLRGKKAMRAPGDHRDREVNADHKVCKVHKVSAAKIIMSLRSKTAFKVVVLTLLPVFTVLRVIRVISVQSDPGDLKVIEGNPACKGLVVNPVIALLSSTT
ncbi:hypothetical protein ACFGXM_00720 [Pasteurella multocida]